MRMQGEEAKSVNGTVALPALSEAVVDPRLARDPELIRMIRYLTDLLFLPTDRLAPDVIRLIDDVLGRVISFAPLEERVRIANRLLGLSRPPRHLARSLIHDRMEVAATLLQGTSRLHDQDLISVIHTCSSDHGRTIAVREDLSPSVLYALARSGKPALVRAMLNNHSATLGRPEFECIVETAIDQPELWDPLLARSDLPNDLGLRLFWSFDTHRRLRILKRCMADRSLIHELLPEQTLERLAEIDPMLREAIRPLRQTGHLSETATARLVQTVGEGDRKEIVAALAAQADICAELASRILTDQSGEAFGVLAKALGLSRRAFKDLHKGLYPKSTPQPASGDEPADYSAWKIFDALSWVHADSIMRCWDQSMRAEIEGSMSRH